MTDTDADDRGDDGTEAEAGTPEDGGADEAAERSPDQETGSEADEGTGDGTAEGAAAEAVGEELRERIAETDPEMLAGEVAGLRERADEAEAALAARQERIEELESRLKRERADFQNYKKRMEERRERERRRATADLVERLLDVRDNLARALDQDEDVDVRDGVESTLRQFDRVLEDEDVGRVEPSPGDAVDPERHEVLTTVPSDHPGGTVAELYRPGYEMGERVIRPAQVTVSEETDEADGDAADTSGDAEADEADADDERGAGGDEPGGDSPGADTDAPGEGEEP